MKFGTDGVRGRADTPPIDEDSAIRLGALVGARAPVVWVGWDTRPTGARLSRALAQGIASQGSQARLAGVLPTPGLITCVEESEGAMGVMVTASHNPASDNGFKVIWPGGYKPTDAQARALEQAWDDPLGAGGSGSVVDRVADARERYEQAFVSRVGDLSGLVGRRLVVDLAHGAATATAPALLGRLGIDVVVRGSGDGTINDRCGSEHPEALGAWVRETEADAGLAVDGDGDRTLLVDASGAVVPGDAVIALLAKHAGASSVAVTVMSTAAMEGWLPGVQVIRTPVGDRHIAQVLREGRAALGGEDSGHLLFADGLRGGDGLFAGLRALNAAFGRADRLASAVSEYAPFPRRLTKVRVTRRPAVDSEPGLVAQVRDAERALGPGGRVYLRYSGTEPVLRILVEGREASVVEAVSGSLTVGCGEVLA